MSLSTVEPSYIEDIGLQEILMKKKIMMTMEMLLPIVRVVRKKKIIHVKLIL